jgi:predicted phosphoribosyltransferase
MGAVASGDTIVFNENVMQQLGGTEFVDSVIARERVELQRRERMYRDEQAPPEVRNRIVILVDDGLATGATMRAAVQAIRAQQPAKLVVAVPVASPDVCADIGKLVDEMICSLTPTEFYAVGLWYDDFSETTDQEVRDLLRQANQFQHDSAEEKR